jgi:transposase InsO family protein
MATMRERQREVQRYRGQIPSPGAPTVAWREDRVRFWTVIALGEKTDDAAAAAGVSSPVGYRWFRHAGGVNPCLPPVVSGRYLSFSEREDIALLKAQGLDVREIARRVGRDPSPRAPTSPAGTPRRSKPLPPHSTRDHARSSAGRPRPKPSTNIYAPSNEQVLLRSIEPGQYTSWLFGSRLRATGLLGSMGTVGDCFDNSVAEAFFSGLQRELLDQHDWATREDLALALFDWIETWYNPRRRHSYNNGLSPIDCETANAA